MGTRGLISVFSNGEYKIAQYCQFDSYFEGQGASVLDFLKQVDLTKFKKAIDECYFVDENIVCENYPEWHYNDRGL